MTSTSAGSITGPKPLLRDKSKLYALFLLKLPNHRVNDYTLSMMKIAKDVGVSTQALHKWFKKDRVPPLQVTNLTQLPGSRLTKTELLRFVIR